MQTARGGSQTTADMNNSALYSTLVPYGEFGRVGYDASASGLAVLRSHTRVSSATGV
jgi:hypothetical protein